MTGYLVLIAVIAIAGWLIRLAVTEQGPNPYLVLVRRYSVWPWVAALAMTAWLVAYIFARPLAYLATGATAFYTLCAALVFGWNRRSPYYALRRMILRARWPSAVRAAGGGTTKDRRSRDWPGGTTVTIGSEIVEWLPRISHGRALPNRLGVRYVVRPARGSTLGHLRQLEEPLAAALNVAEVVINDRVKPSRGTLDVLWSDTLAEPVQATP